MAYGSLICLSLIGSVCGLVGFLDLSSLPVDTQSTDYSQILTVLSLLATAVISGFFAWSFTDSVVEEIWLVTAVSACFYVLFYLLFGAISFYIGKSPSIHNAQYATTISAVIMWLILVVNVLLDFWDYLDPRPVAK